MEAEEDSMPLRDHFRPPVWKRASWEGFHGMWPATMVQRLAPLLPDDYTAEPRVHLGSYFEIDVSTYEETEPKKAWTQTAANGGATTVVWAPPAPTLTVDVDLDDQYAYEVLVFDQARGRRLVAAIEIVSPANKDRRENRRAFVTKCAALLQQDVSVSIVDVVTTRRFNLYQELLALFKGSDPAFRPKPPSIYAVTCRWRRTTHASQLGAWPYRLQVGQPLPSLPVWLSDDVHVMLDLEGSYADACSVLRIP
jgi:hypothetical protein